MSEDAANGLDVIAPPAATVQFRGRDLQVTPLTVGQLPPFARAIKPMLGTIGNAIAGGLSPALIIDLIAEHGEAAVNAISIATRVPADEINAAAPDELLLLVAEVLSANKDFLTRLLNQAQQAVARAASPGTGPIPSSP